MRLPLVGLALLATLLPAHSQSPQERVTVCLACHGENGQSQTAEVPSLGAQPEYYVTIQLVMFRDKLRTVEVMNNVMAGTSDDVVRGLARLVSKLPAPQPTADAADQGRMQRAEALAQKNHCNVCHRTDFSGGENVPRLAGQREDYLVKALRGYKDNSRRGYDASMAEVVVPLTDDQILDLAYYLARVR
ncbi:MAG TPA: c-type cytochrome [Xanthobacteraceae bacterium]|jgi:cytochrome c553